MTRDPIVREVHRIRTELLDECGGDLGKLCQRLKAAETAHPERLVSPKQLRARAAAEETPSVQG